MIQAKWGYRRKSTEVLAPQFCSPLFEGKVMMYPTREKGATIPVTDWPKTLLRPSSHLLSFRLEFMRIASFAGSIGTPVYRDVIGVKLRACFCPPTSSSTFGSTPIFLSRSAFPMPDNYNNFGDPNGPAATRTSLLAFRTILLRSRLASERTYSTPSAGAARCHQVELLAR